MSKTVLFVLFLAFPTVTVADFLDDFLKHASDNPSCSEEFKKILACAQPHFELIREVYPKLNSISTLYNIGLMNKGLQLVENVTICLGEEKRDFKCTLPKIVVTSLDYAQYIGKKVYGDAFHCFINVNAIETFQICAAENQQPRNIHENVLNDESAYKKIAQPIVECMAKKMYETPSCTIDRIVELYHAGEAGLDLYYSLLKFVKGVQVERSFSDNNYCRA